MKKCIVKLSIILLLGILSFTTINCFAQHNRYDESESMDDEDLDRKKDDGISWISIIVIGGVIYWVWSGGWGKKDNQNK